MLRRCSAKRKGSLVAIVIIALIVVSLLMAAIVQTLVNEHRQSRVAEQRLQMDWLERAALDRAMQSLAKDPAYVGETWKIPSDVLAAEIATDVRIRVGLHASDAAQRVIDLTISASNGGRSQVQRQINQPIRASAPRQMDSNKQPTSGDTR